MQPLTSGVWAVDNSPDGAIWVSCRQIQLRESDIVTFHNYTGRNTQASNRVAEKVQPASALHEYYGALRGSTFDTVLPIAKQENVGRSIGIGRPARRKRTAWDSWQHPYVLDQPGVVSRGTASRRDALPPGRGGPDPAADGKAIRDPGRLKV